ncbi:hypothetical protein GQ600_15978 [Phytophthora cactorum]|nr:hypothetical protein GQ600_15978 [Phytophthora cactorum]
MHEAGSQPPSCLNKNKYISIFGTSLQNARLLRTSFTNTEDKLLVQIAYQFEKEGLRNTWRYVAKNKTKHPSNELRLRLANIKRTHGKSLRHFPRSLFTGLQTKATGDAPPSPPPRV